MTGKEYRGIRTRPFGAKVIVTDIDGREYKLPHLIHHSPTGLEWGYGGSGPSDLALSILHDHLGLVAGADYCLVPSCGTRVCRVTWEEYHPFKFQIIAALLWDGWVLTSDQIDEALLYIQAEREKGKGHV